MRRKYIHSRPKESSILFYIMDNFPPTSFEQDLKDGENNLMQRFEVVITNIFQSILCVDNVKLNRARNDY